jgi:hypothetical protein
MRNKPIPQPVYSQWQNRGESHCENPVLISQ